MDCWTESVDVGAQGGIHRVPEIFCSQEKPGQHSASGHARHRNRSSCTDRKARVTPGASRSFATGWATPSTISSGCDQGLATSIIADACRLSMRIRPSPDRRTTIRARSAPRCTRRTFRFQSDAFELDFTTGSTTPSPCWSIRHPRLPRSRGTWSSAIALFTIDRADPRNFDWAAQPQGRSAFGPLRARWGRSSCPIP